MKRKLIILICIAACVFSGCGTRESSGVNVFSTGAAVTASLPSSSAVRSSETSVFSSKSVVSSQTISQSVWSTSAPSLSSQTTPIPPQESSVASEAPPASNPPEIETQTVVYSHDPKNVCTIMFDGTTIVIRGKIGDLLSDVEDDYPNMSVECSTDGDEAVYTLTPKSISFNQRYGWFYILDKNGYMNYINVEMTASGITFPDASSLAENNDRVVDSAANASAGKTLQYITRNGKRDKAPQVLEEIKRISDKICEGIDSDYEKLRAISYWVSENIYYDRPAYSKGIPQECLSLEYMLDNKSSVCGGYSNMTSALCAAQGIRCLNITGSGIITGHSFLEGLAGGFHEWNVAEIDGRYIIVDSGWNSHNDFSLGGIFTSKPMSYKYFDIGKEIFALDHKAQTAEYRDYWAFAED